MQKQDETDAWAAQLRNALDYAEKALLRQREHGAEIVLGQARNMADTSKKAVAQIDAQLLAAEAHLRKQRGAEVQHHAQIANAQSELGSVEVKARAESQTSDRLQSKLDVTKGSLRKLQ